ncbi:hypothetical protein GCM10010266_59450 [Streptomyces griseomycini]|nr:hypothetical protein GCM10010266_59450 [Streptomyces griseomycini]
MAKVMRTVLRPQGWAGHRTSDPGPALTTEEPPTTDDPDVNATRGRLARRGFLTPPGRGRHRKRT